MNKMKDFWLMLKGMAMGMAEAIPGVSGGTIAFITGIYEELLTTIKSVTPSNLKLLFKDPKQAFQNLNGKFLVWLLLGMATGLVLGVLILGRLLITDKELLWAFFFGIVLASSIYFALHQHWTTSTLAICLAGAVLSFVITMVSPAAGSDNFIYIYAAGVLAVSALMLPGISGSFILLLLGLYETIILSLKSLLSSFEIGRNVAILAIFALGALTGLFSFARILSYLFKNYHQHTMGFMIGILLGSLNKLWPWKIIQTALNEESGQIENVGSTVLPSEGMYKIVSEQNIGPALYGEYSDPRVFGIIICFVLGLVLIAFMSRAGSTKDNSAAG